MILEARAWFGWRTGVVASGMALVMTVNGTAQASPYVPLDDPGLPFVEHLITRGDVADPSPFIRPFRRADIRQALARADSAHLGDTALIARLLDRYGKADTVPTWRIEPRLGAQAYTHARRDPLHPAGPDGVQPYGELWLDAVFGNLVLVTRPVIEPRLIDDPDWPGRKDIEVASRQADASSAPSSVGLDCCTDNSTATGDRSDSPAFRSVTTAMAGPNWASR